MEITGSESAAWERAARALARSEPTEGDCVSIHLEVCGGEARLTFTTRDGRSAERALEDPDELAPTVEALRVTGPGAERSPQPPPEPKGPAASHRPPGADRAPVGRPAAAPAPPDSGTNFAVQGGTRGGADYLMSPVLAGSASLALQRWELGVMAALDLQYFDVRNDPRRAPSSAVVAGVIVGRREPLGSVALLASGRMMLAVLNDESENDGGDIGRAEARLGAFCGVVLPRRAGIRFRADMGVDLVPHDIGGSSSSADAPITAWWAVSALVGVEIGGP